MKSIKLPFQRAPEQVCRERIIPLTGDIFQDTISSELIHSLIHFFKVSNIFLDKPRKCFMHWTQLQQASTSDARTYLFTRRRVLATGKKNGNKKTTHSTVILQLSEHYRSSLKGQLWRWRKMQWIHLASTTLTSPRLLLILVQTPPLSQYPCI